MNLKIEEYKNLYNELHSSSDKVSFAINLMYSISVGVITYGLSQGDSVNNLIFLAPLILIIPLTFFIYSQLNAIARIGSYIKVFHEGKENGLLWETRVSKFKTPKNLRKSKYARSLQMMIGGLALICFLLTFFETNGEKILREISISAIVLSLFFLAITTYSLILIRDAKAKYFHRYEEVWRNIKNLEGNQRPIDFEQPSNLADE